MFFLGTVVGAFVAVLLGLITLDLPAVHLAVWQDWVGIAYAPPSPPPAPSAIFNSVDYANDFYLLSKGNFTALASPPSFDSTIPLWEPAFDNSPPTTAGFFDKVFDTFNWFLVVMVTHGLGLLPFAYVTARSLRDRRTKDLKSLASGRDEERSAFILEVQAAVVASEEAQLERDVYEASVLQLQQVALELEKDNLRRFRESQAEKESLTLAIRTLEAELLAQKESTNQDFQRRTSAVIKEVEAAMGRRIEELEEGMKEEEERSRQLEIGKEMAEGELVEEMRVAEEMREKAAERRREAEEDFGRALDAVGEKLEEEKEKARKSEEARQAAEEAKEKAEEEKEKAEKEVARLKNALQMKEAAAAAKQNWHDSRNRMAQYGSGRPVDPRQVLQPQQPFQQQPFQQQPFQQQPPNQRFGQWNQPPPGGR